MSYLESAHKSTGQTLRFNEKNCNQLSRVPAIAIFQSFSLWSPRGENLVRILFSMKRRLCLVLLCADFKYDIRFL